MKERIKRHFVGFIMKEQIKQHCIGFRMKERIKQHQQNIFGTHILIQK